jgi:GNAT superfamily N-acetyltransferase
MTLSVRPATPADAPAMAALINRIIAKGGTTAFTELMTPDSLIADLLRPPGAVCCHVALQDGGIVGFQSLFMADPAWPGPDALTADWGLIGTYVDVDRQGTGAGTALFAATLQAARAAGVTKINATIQRVNTGGLAYYGRMGFVEWRNDDLSISKRYDLT